MSTRTVSKGMDRHTEIINKGMGPKSRHGIGAVQPKHSRKTPVVTRPNYDKKQRSTSATAGETHHGAYLLLIFMFTLATIGEHQGNVTRWEKCACQHVSRKNEWLDTGTINSHPHHTQSSHPVPQISASFAEFRIFSAIFCGSLHNKCGENAELKKCGENVEKTWK